MSVFSVSLSLSESVICLREEDSKSIYLSELECRLFIDELVLV